MVHGVNHLPICIFKPVRISAQDSVNSISQTFCHVIDTVLIAHIVDQITCVTVPLRYNYDKPEKPRRIKGFEVFSLIFSSFSKPKNHTEISRIAGGVSLTTNE